jgi:REP element-mobilizing transposase RayT
MSRKFRIADQDKPHFVTFTVIHWIDIFIRDEYRQIFVDSVKYCQVNKNLEVFAYCVMPSHVHMILRTDSKNPLEGVIRNLKSFTSRSIRKILETQGHIESRKEWLLHMMYNAGRYNSNNRDWQFWQQHNNPIELSRNESLDRTLDYIHMNPVKAGFVNAPEAWICSSAGDYHNTSKGPIELVFIH